MGEYLQQAYAERDLAIELAEKHGLIKDYKRLQEQIKEANEVIKDYANKENWCNYYTEDDELMKDSLYCDCDGPLKATVYLERWGVK